MATYRAYYDDSGTHDASGWPIVAGVVATPHGSATLTTEWAGTLRGFGLTFFHAKDCWARQGQCAGWPRERSRACFETLAGALTSHVLATVAVGVSVADVERLFPTKVVDYLGGSKETAVVIASYSCMYQTHALLRDRIGDPHPAVDHTFSRGFPGYGKVLAIGAYEHSSRLRGEDNLGPVAAARMDEVPMLQAADLMAWEVNRQRVNEFKPAPLPARDDLARLAALPRFWAIHSPESLGAWVLRLSWMHAQQQLGPNARTPRQSPRTRRAD